MKYCPICEKKFSDESEACDLDGAKLKPSSAAADSLVGRLIKGRYQVRKKLGAGGMGAVYLAEQVSIGRRVALKVLHGAYAGDEEFVRRFRHEARMAASLNHHNIVTVYDFDQADDGSLFIAMEYVDGRSLSEIIQREGPLDVSRAVHLGFQIGEGLEAAHRAGVIHRDIKPDNMMVVGFGEKEEVKLMDFGIARLRDTGTMTRLTRSGVLMGTPAYMAPEQIEGGGDVSERTDIYALGIVLYEMLSGGTPFRASTPGTVLVKQLRETPVHLRKLRREIPATVERVVMQALEKNPQKRQQDMAELIQGLKRTGSPSGEVEIPRKIVEGWPLWQRIVDKFQGQKNKVFVSLAVIAGIALVVWLGAWIGKREPEPDSGRKVTEPLVSTKPVEAPQPPVALAEPKVPNAKIPEHMKLAASLRDRGEFTESLAELEKARAIDPTDTTVKAEIERIRRHCLAEKKLGLTEERCD